MPFRKKLITSIEGQAYEVDVKVYTLEDHDAPDIKMECVSVFKIENEERRSMKVEDQMDIFIKSFDLLYKEISRGYWDDLPVQLFGS